MEESDAFEFQLQALKAEVDSITQRLAGAETTTEEADGDGRNSVPAQRPAAGRRRRKDEELPRGASPVPTPLGPLLRSSSTSTSSSTPRPGMLLPPLSPPTIVRRHPPPRSASSRTAQQQQQQRQRPRPSSAPLPMGDGLEREAADEDEEEEEEEDGESALMAWVEGAATLEAQVGRAKQALGELVRERDAALQAFKREQREAAGLRGRVRELEGLEQDLATLKIALESSERIRLQQRGLLDLYEAQHRHGHHGANKDGIASLNHHDVPPATACTPAPERRRPPPPQPPQQEADAAWVDECFLDYALRHPPKFAGAPAVMDPPLLMTPATTTVRRSSSPRSGSSSRSSSSSWQHKERTEAAKLARRLQDHKLNGGSGPALTSSATAASLRRAAAAGHVVLPDGGGRRPELSEESLRWRRYREGDGGRVLPSSFASPATTTSSTPRPSSVSASSLRGLGLSGLSPSPGDSRGV